MLEIVNVKKVLEVPTLDIGKGGFGYYHCFDLCTLAHGAIWICGSGAIVVTDIQTLEPEDISWYDGDIVDPRIPMPTEEPWVTPYAIKAYSDAVFRIVGYLDRRILILETSDRGESWDQVKLLSASDEHVVQSGCLLENGIGYLSTSDETHLKIIRFDSFGTSRTLWTRGKIGEFDGARSLVFANDLSGWFVLDVDDGSGQSHVYETEDGGSTWKSIRTVIGSVGLAVDGDACLWIFGERGLAARWRGGEWIDEMLPRSFDVSTAGVGGPGIPLLMNETGYGMALTEEGWSELRTDELPKRCWQNVLWLDERSMIFVDMGSVYYAESRVLD